MSEVKLRLRLSMKYEGVSHLHLPKSQKDGEGRGPYNMETYELI